MHNSRSGQTSPSLLSPNGSMSKAMLSSTVSAKHDESLSLSQSNVAYTYDTPSNATDSLLPDSNHFLNLLEQPKYVKVYKKSKQSGKSFQRLFLAQELKPALDETAAIWVTKFSTDGKYLAVGRQDGWVVIWKVISSPLSRLENQLAPSNSRKRSSSGSSTSTSKLGSSVLSGGSSNVNDIGPDSSLLICPDSSYTINNKVFAPVLEEVPFRKFQAHASGVVSLDWSKNNFLVTGSIDKDAKLWHVDRPAALQTFQHDEFVTSVVFHPTDDRFFLSGCMDSHLRLWSILDGEVSYQIELPGLVTAVTFTPDGETCIAGGLGWCSVLQTRGLDKVYDFHIKSSSSSNSVGPKITGIELYDELDPVTNTTVTKLIVTSNDSRIRKFNLKTRSVETKYKGLANDHSQVTARLSENQTFIISGSENHWCYIWSLNDEGHISNKDKAKETFKKLFGSNSQKRSQHSLDANTSGSSGANTMTQKNGSYLVFHAHHTEVTCALFAPILTSKLIELSNDPLFELHTCYQIYLSSVNNNIGEELAPLSSCLKPVMSPRDSSLSLASTLALHKNTTQDEVNPEYSIIVTADKHGTLRVFRRDFVYNIRKALKHDFLWKLKHRRQDHSDNVSVNSTRPGSISGMSKDLVQLPSTLPSKNLTIDTDLYVPLGLGNINSSIDESFNHQDEYSLSSDSSLGLELGGSHVANERPLKDSSLDSIEGARGRKTESGS